MEMLHEYSCKCCYGATANTATNATASAANIVSTTCTASRACTVSTAHTANITITSASKQITLNSQRVYNVNIKITKHFKILYMDALHVTFKRFSLRSQRHNVWNRSTVSGTSCSLGKFHTDFSH